MAKGTANTILLDGRGWLKRTLRRALACAILIVASAGAQAQDASCPANLGTSSVIDHDFSASFCELCSVGTVRIEIENPFGPSEDADMSDIVVTEDLLASGLSYVPNTTQFIGSGVSAPPVVEPVVTNGSSADLDPLRPVRPAQPAAAATRGSPSSSRSAATRESRRGLVNANRNIQAQLEFTPSCDLNFRQVTTGGFGELSRRGAASPTSSSWAATSTPARAGPSTRTRSTATRTTTPSGASRSSTTGTVDLQDLRFDDNMQPGNFLIDWICDDEGDAESAGNGGVAAAAASTSAG